MPGRPAHHKHAYIIAAPAATLRRPSRGHCNRCRTGYACRAMKKKTSNSFSFLITDTGRLVGKRFDQRARDVLDLSRAQCSVLAHLDRHPNIHQAQLADLLGVTPIAGARLLDRMEAGGWIVRASDAHDRRLRRPVLTDKARNALSDARK